MAEQAALSLWQPWATLLIHSFKGPETRGYPTRFRGESAIHASSKSLKSVYRAEGFDHESWCELLKPAFLQGIHFPLGVVLGVMKLVDCVRAEDIRDSLTPYQQSAGNYADGRFAWIFEPVEIFSEPIPAKGALGFWKWERP